MRPYQLSVLLSLASLMLVDSSGFTRAAEPVRLIFDTDMGNDVDDALALGVIHALQTRGACELLAVTVTKDNNLAAPFIDAVNTFYNCGEIPIGVVRRGKTPQPGKFLPLAERKDDDRFRYPHNLLSGQNAPEAVGLLRKILTSQPDGSIVLVQVGFSTNFIRLLESQPDEHSKLSGRELIEKKVRLLSMMAGAFQTIRGNKRYLEYNVVQDIPSAQTLADKWPTRIVYSGFEIGIAIPYPSESIDRDFGYVPHHPIAEAYRLYCKPNENRPTWDLTSVLYAVYPDRGFFDVSPRGRVTVEADGFTRFDKQSDGPHQYLIASPEQIIRTKEALVQLTSQPPR